MNAARLLSRLCAAALCCMAVSCASGSGPERMLVDCINAGGRDDTHANGWSVCVASDGSSYLITRPYVRIQVPQTTLKLVLGVANLFIEGAEGSAAAFASPNVLDLFGASAAMTPDAGIVAIGAPSADSRYAGAVYLYAKTVQGWPMDEKNKTVKPAINTSGNPGSAFGASVALSGDGLTLVVGAPWEGGFGRAMYFLGPRGGWATLSSPDQIGSGYLGVGGPASGDEFGRSVAISRDDQVIAVGAPGRNGGTGLVCLFKKPEKGWQFTQNLFPIQIPEGHPGDRFGQSLAVSRDGKVIIIGAPGCDGGNGAVFIAVAAASGDGSYSLTKISTKNKMTGFGSMVALSADGRTIAASAYGAEMNGAVWIYRSDSGAWDQDNRLVDWYFPKSGDAKGAGAFFGYGLAITDNGSRVMIGAPLYDTGRGMYWWIDVK
jgi:hypothetical protein